MTTSPRSPSLPGAAPTTAPYDPLRLCVYATIALLGWLGGPVTLLVFAGLGFAGYLSARRAGLTRSRCFLRDTRLVLGYLAALGAVAGVATALRVAELLR
jgi:hypothetical protein